MRKEKSSKSSKAAETYVIDTNIILTNPNFDNQLDGTIVVPDIVLEELDNHKSGFTQKAINARTFARKLDANFDDYKIAKTNDKIVKNDHKIIDIAVAMHNSDIPITLLTNDIYMSAIARSQGIRIMRYEDASTDIDLYTGTTEGDLVYPNQYQSTKAGVFKLKDGEKTRLSRDKKVFGIQHKNLEQKFVMDALLDEDIKLVTISGAAGTGKTLLSIACGLQQVIEQGIYHRLIVARPIVPMGNEIGFLPGEMEEKLAPWMQPIFDNINQLFAESGKKKANYEDFINEGFLQMEALAYIRGRSIPNEIILIDEGQNLSPHEIKTIITRAGESTKIIITGDIAQIDNPRLDQYSNGLTYAVEKFKDQAIAAHITLTKCERSELAKVAGEIM